MTIGGEARLRHPTLGFSVRDPGASFNPVPASERDSEDMRISPYVAVEAGQAFQVGITPIGGDGERGFREFVDGMLSGIRKSAAAQKLTVAESRHDVTWTGGHGEAHIVGQINTTTMQLAAYTITRRDGATLAVAVIGIADSPTAFTDVLASFKP